MVVLLLKPLVCLLSLKGLLSSLPLTVLDSIEQAKFDPLVARLFIGNALTTSYLSPIKYALLRFHLLNRLRAPLSRL